MDSSKLKEFADDNFKFDENGRKLSKWVENTVGKGEIARYEQFLLFTQCFQKARFPGASKGIIVWEWVKVAVMHGCREKCDRQYWFLTDGQTLNNMPLSSLKQGINNNDENQEARKNVTCCSDMTEICVKQNLNFPNMTLCSQAIDFQQLFTYLHIIFLYFTTKISK